MQPTLPLGSGVGMPFIFLSLSPLWLTLILLLLSNNFHGILLTRTGSQQRTKACFWHAYST